MANNRKKKWMLEKTLSTKRQEKRTLIKSQNEQLLEEKRNEMFSRQQAMDIKLAQRNQVPRTFTFLLNMCLADGARTEADELPEAFDGN